jgi:hypothetical protein
MALGQRTRNWGGVTQLYAAQHRRDGLKFWPALFQAGYDRDGQLRGWDRAVGVGRVGVFQPEQVQEPSSH